MRRTHRLATLAVAATVLVGCTGGGSGDDRSAAVETAALEATGSARLDGDAIVVDLAGGPVQLSAAGDTTFFVCTGEDCEVVDEATFRAEVREGDDIRVLGPNAELLTPDSEQLPAQVWVVLERSAG